MTSAEYAGPESELLDDDASESEESDSASSGELTRVRLAAVGCGGDVVTAPLFVCVWGLGVRPIEALASPKAWSSDVTTCSICLFAIPGDCSVVVGG